MKEEYDVVVTALETLSAESLTLSSVKNRLLDGESKRQSSEKKHKVEFSYRQPLQFQQIETQRIELQQIEEEIILTTTIEKAVIQTTGRMLRLLKIREIIHLDVSNAEN